MAKNQQSLFDAEPPEWELDAQAKLLVASVVMPKGPAKNVTDFYDYLIPDKLADQRQPESLVEAGRRVKIPFGRGNRTVVGYCVAVETKPVPSNHRLKEIASVLDTSSIITPTMLRLTKWMAEHYLTPWGKVLEGVVPSGVRGQAGTRDVTLLSVPTKVVAGLSRLKLPPKQRAVLEALAASQGPMTLKQLSMQVGCTTAPINALRKQGLIETTVERLDTDFLTKAADAIPERHQPKQLNEDQQRTLDSILASLESGKHETILIHGVTSSGKTEVYIQAIERVVSYGRQAIVLVPEISLTPQTVGRFRERFDHIAVLHSHLSDVERHRYWRRIATGEIQVVVGARSAIFAPTPHLGLVVIDEEHETSFKQETNPRYHARDVAIERTKAEGVPLLLASATPSLDSWYRTHPKFPDAERYQLTTMPSRIGGLPMPAVRTIDLRSEAASSNRGAISRPLHQAMEQTLRDDGQIILLLNRRGYSTHLRCPGCNEVVECPNCAVSMTFHREMNKVLCHWCDHRCDPPQKCPTCKSPKILYGGFGTQKLEAEVRARFRNVPLVRMDADTMRQPGSHQRALDAFREGETKILLGTQMIAKGLDFPNVTLVGVINADSALHLPDFRAAERTFHLVTQVAGRTGRGEKGGRVLVQTFQPEHPAIQAAVRHDYAMFAKSELPERKMLGYPPYGAMGRVVSRGPSEIAVETFISAVADRFRETSAKMGIELRALGPAVAPIARLQNDFRYHLQLQTADRASLHAVASACWNQVMMPEGVRAIIDLDPVDMM